MAPTAVENVAIPQEVIVPKYAVHKGVYKELAATKYDVDIEKTGKDGFQAAKYPHYLPTWNPEQKYGPLTPFEHVEHGKNADTSYKNLLPEGSTTTDLTPSIGVSNPPFPLIPGSIP